MGSVSSGLRNTTMIACKLALCLLAVPALSLPRPAGGAGGGVGGHGGDHYNEKPDPFHFKYGVHDDKYYTDFGEERSGDGAGNIKGEYYVHLPDGRVQHVIYHADGNYGGTIMERHIILNMLGMDMVDMCRAMKILIDKYTMR